MSDEKTTNEKTDQVESVEELKEKNSISQPKEDDKNEDIPKVYAEIDYDKLANAIISAHYNIEKIDNVVNEEVQKFIDKKIEEKNKEKITAKDFFKTLWMIIIGKTDKNDAIDVEVAMGVTTMSLLRLISGFERFISLTCFILCIYFGITSQWIGINIGINILVIVALLSISLMLLLLGGTTKIMANGISKENDRNYVVSIFSGMTGFLAMLIAIIALIISKV